MNEQIVIEFVSDTKGLKDAADQLKALGKMSDEQYQAFMRMNETASTSMQERLVSTKQVAAEEKKAVQSVDELNQSFKDLVTTIAKGVLDTVIDEAQQWQKEADEAAQSNVRLSAELRKTQNELVKMAVAGKEGTKEFKELQKAAGKLKDDIGDVSARIKHFSSDTRHIDAVVQGFQAMTGAIAAVKGAQALFGDESEYVQKALLRVNAALALATGTQQVFQALQKEGAIVQGLLELKTYAYGAAVRTVTAIQTAFGVSAQIAWAAATAGVSLLVVGIGYLIYKWHELNGVIKEAFNVEGALNTVLEARGKYAEKQARYLEREANLRKAISQTTSGDLKIEIGLLQKKSDLIDRQLELTKESDIAYAKATIASKQSTEEQIDAAKRFIATVESLKERQLDIANEIAIRRIELERALYEEMLAADRKFWKDVKVLAVNQTSDIANTINTGLAGKVEPIPFNLKPLKLDFELVFGAMQEQLKSVQSEFQATINLANALVNAMSEMTQANLQNELAAIDAKREAELKNKSLTEEQKAKIQEKYDKQERALRKKAFEQDKKMKITLAMINGAAGVVNAFANAPNPFVAAAQAAAIAATTAAQIAIISQQQFPAYATGTEFVEGAGTPTSDSIMARLSVGERVVPASLNKMLGGVPNELLPKLVHDGLLIQQHRQGTDFDYEKLGDAVAKQLSKQPKLVMNLDETGFSKHLIKGNSRQRILNSRYGIA